MPTFKNDDRTLHYEVRGDGPLLLFLPGNTASSAAHTGELDHFSDRFTVASLDFWGTGRSGRAPRWPDDWFSICAQDTAELVKHLGFETAVLVGCSGSVQTALHIEIMFPGTASAMVLDSGMEIFPKNLILEDVASRQNPDSDLVEFWRQCHGEDWEAVVIADSQFLLRFADKGSALVHGKLDSINCPTLVTACRDDRTVPNAPGEALDLSLKLGNGQACVFEGGAHPAMWAVPDQFRAAADDFLNTAL